MQQGNGGGWRRVGDGYEIDWCGAPWAFLADGARPGLSPRGRGARHLALVGLTAIGRRDDRAFAPEALVGLELVHDRLLATFEPRGWHGLTVRAAWGPSREGRGMDLEVQASASSVGELRRLEVVVESSTYTEGWPETDGTEIFPRDREAAASSYDGREPSAVLAGLQTYHVPPTCEPGDCQSLWFCDAPPAVGSILSMGRLQDVARWSFAGVQAEGGGAVRSSVFGFDLEKGVVLRCRLREVRWPNTDPIDAIAAEEALLLADPPSLRTE